MRLKFIKNNIKPRKPYTYNPINNDLKEIKMERTKYENAIARLELDIERLHRIILKLLKN